MSKYNLISVLLLYVVYEPLIFLSVTAKTFSFNQYDAIIYK